MSLEPRAGPRILGDSRSDGEEEYCRNDPGDCHNTSIAPPRFLNSKRADTPRAIDMAAGPGFEVARGLIAPAGLMPPLRQSSGSALQAFFRSDIDYFKLAVGIDFAGQCIRRQKGAESPDRLPKSTAGHRTRARSCAARGMGDQGLQEGGVNSAVCLISKAAMDSAMVTVGVRVEVAKGL